jgi:hypothetical protein
LSVRSDFIDGLIDAVGIVYDNDHEWGSFFNRQYTELKLDSKELALQIIELFSMDMHEVNYWEEEVDGRTKYCLFVMIPTVTYMRTQQHGKEIKKNCIVKNLDYEGNVINVEKLDIKDYGYGAVTVSGHYNVSGVYLGDCSER